MSAHCASCRRLRPGGGRHVNHTHPQGWLSSAFYVDLPEAVNGGGEAGWILFGEPGCPQVVHGGSIGSHGNAPPGSVPAAPVELNALRADGSNVV